MIVDEDLKKRPVPTPPPAKQNDISPSGAGYSYSQLFPPNIAVDRAIIQFWENFFRISDSPGALAEYIRQFTSDATFIMGSRMSKGRVAIFSTRKNMWAGVTSRRHTVLKFFPYGDNDGREVMLHGKVVYRYEDGTKGEKDWAARAEIVKDEGDGEWRLRFYQVYLDTGSSPSTN